MIIAAAAGLTAAGVAVGVLTQSTAQAIPRDQQNCDLSQITNDPSQGWMPVEDSEVEIDNLNQRRYVVINFNADAYVTSGAWIRIAYSVDGGPPRTLGARYFATASEFPQARHSMVVWRLPRGQHQIQPYWRVFGPVGSTGELSGRCTTAEAYTR
jgi:hypothetical protein